MFALRRAATRALASPAFTPIRSSPFTRSYSLLLSSRQSIASPLSSSLTWQRRFASDEAETRQEPAADGGVEHTESASEQLQSDAAEQQTTGNQSGSTIEQAVGTAAQAVQGSRAPDAVKDAAASAASKVAGVATGTNTVFCGNLFYHVTEAQLEAELSKYGTVESVKITRDPRGLSRGFGFVKFSSPDEAAHAIEVGHNTNLEGRLLALSAAKELTRTNRLPKSGASRPSNTPSRTLWIGNMSYDMTDTDLNALFRPLKNVLDVRVAIDRRTGQARGFAHADFIDVESATEAFKQLEEQIVYGRRLKIDYGVSYASDNKGNRNQQPADETPQPTDG